MPEFEELRQRLVDYLGLTPLQNVAGAPAIAVPGGTTADGLPVGVQLSGASGAEGTQLATFSRPSVPGAARAAGAPEPGRSRA